MKTINNIFRTAVATIAIGAFASMVIAAEDALTPRIGWRSANSTHNILPRSTEHSSYTANLIGFVYYAESWNNLSDDQYTPMGIYTIPTTPGAQPEQFAQIGKASSHCNGGAVLAGDTYWYIWNQTDPTGQSGINITQLYSYNIVSGAFQNHGIVSSDLVSISDKSWDPVTGKIYGQFSDGTNYKLSIIDYEAQTVTPVANVEFSYGLTFDNTGQLYGIDGSGNLNKIDKTNGKIEKIGNTGVVPAYAQSMTYDPKTGLIWWASYSKDPNSPSVLYSIDPKTVSVTKVTEFKDREEIMGLGVMPAIAPDKAPGYPSDLKLTTNGDSRDAELSFTIPSYTFLGEDLTGTVSWEAKSNDNRIATGSSTPGSTVTENVTLPTGTNVITVTCSNAEGTGPAATITKWIGQGYPETPQNALFKLDESTGKVTLTWDAVTKAQKEGYLDPATVRYKVIAMPGERVAAENISATTFSETIDEPQAPKDFYYQIIACNGWRESEPAETNHISYGKGIALPYNNSFDNASSLSLFHIIDGNKDGETWRWSKFNNQTAYIFTGTDVEGTQDDWLITPGLDMKAGCRYMLTYFTSGNAGTGKFHDFLEVGFGKGVDPSEYIIAQEKFEYDIADNHKRYDVIVEVKEDGYYRFGFHAVSNCKAGLAMNIDDIHIDVLANYDAPAAVTNITYRTSKGTAPITFTFNAPDKTRKGDKLNSVTMVELWRNHTELVATNTNAKPGKKMQIVDSKGSTGMTTYTLVAYNENGVGERTEVEFWIGLDVPTIPQDVKLRDMGKGNLKLIWEAPEIGARGGYIDPQNLTYNVFQVTNGYAVDYRRGLSDRELIIPQGDNYYSKKQQLVLYGVSTVNTVGESGIVGSTEVIIGQNYSYPFEESWKGASPQNEMWYVARSGENTWEPSSDKSADNDGGSICFRPAADNDMSYISFGKVDMSKAVNPKLIFSYYAVPGKDAFILPQVNGGFADEWVEADLINFANLDGKEGWREVVIDLEQFKQYPYVTVRFLAGGVAAQPIYIDHLLIADRENSGVNEINFDSFGSSLIYDLNGMRISIPNKNGISIIVNPDKTVTKSVF